MATAPLRIAVVDDHPLTLNGFVDCFAHWPMGQVVLKALNGIEYEKQVAEVGHIHVALVDLVMPHRDGYDTIAWIGRHHPRTRTLAFSFDPHPAAVQRVLRLGGCGILSKTADVPEFHRAVLQVHNHGFFYNELVSRELRNTLDKDLAAKHPDARWASLTDTERRVALAYADGTGGTLAAIAERIGMHPETFETHRKNIFKKLGISSRCQLVQLRLDNGWK